MANAGGDKSAGIWTGLWFSSFAAEVILVPRPCGANAMTQFFEPSNPKESIFPIFPVPVYISRVSRNPDFNQDLVGKVEKLRDSDQEGVEACRKEYRTGYTSFFSRNRINLEPDFAEIAEQILRHGEFFSQSLGYSSECGNLALTTMFGTINVKGCYHEMHRHRRSLISGSYYAAADKSSSRISFLDPKAGYRMHEPGMTGQTIFSNLEFSLQPQTGMIVMFPSYLEHWVEMQHSDTPRVGITFNLDFEDQNDA